MADAGTDWSRAQALLAERRYAEAWPLYEARRTLPGIVPSIQADYPEWCGEPLAGRRLMVCAEQGFGDQIMFGRFLFRLRDAGALVTVACHTPLLGRFFQAAGFAVAPFYVDRPLPPADLWCLFGSLPFRLGAIPPGPARYVEFSAGPPSGVGVIWRGNAKNRNDAHRSLPEGLAPALLRHGRDISPEATGARDFLETAAVMAHLERVITVDTAAAHLAGALGVPTTVLLPHAALDWRWNDGCRSDWYPGAQLIRQPRPGDWDSVLEQLG